MSPWGRGDLYGSDRRIIRKNEMVFERRRQGWSESEIRKKKMRVFFVGREGGEEPPRILRRILETCPVYTKITAVGQGRVFCRI